MTRIVESDRIRGRKLGQMSELEEFESKGFTQSSNNTNLLVRLRVYYRDNFRIFKSGLKGCGNAKSSKYGSTKIFGHHLEYYYDIRRKEEFVKYLEEEFCKENPSPDSHTKREFTKLLHSHGLHWKDCCKRNKKSVSGRRKEEESGMVKERKKKSGDLSKRKEEKI